MYQNILRYSFILANSNMETKTCELKKIDSLILANFILKHYGKMSHLKLQKLIYYCDAYNLAYFGEELISDKFEAWVHGPVSRKLYDSLKDKSKLYSDIEYPINCSDNVDKEFEKLNLSQKELITEVLNLLSTWSGLELEKTTHKELPWIEARMGYGEADKCSKEISKETTRTFYQKELYGQI